MPDGSVLFHCEHCGWGKERLAAARQAGTADEAPEGPSTAMQLLRLTFWWALTLTIIFGPYLALQHVAAEQLSAGGPDAGRLVGWLDPWYWVIGGLYLIAAYTFSPQPFNNNYGLFGTFIDNPFSFQDDLNRTLLTLAIVLMPGKAVWHTVGLTYGTIRRQFPGGPEREA